MFSKSLRNADHTRRFQIVATPSGWEMREEHDSQLVRRVEYHDWHRVERARRLMTFEMEELQHAGWRQIAD
ncbi:MAG: hypothetical protein IT178_11490 [Acidobacteria bacterium]|nr:hypothetical protein [Acidobacteriota bacterium]